ncbi:MAG: ABC transporter ATP-binding protein [Caldilineaceae bacterium]|nr:ABC transporter ATP-binding protein [Caldilineaceae bacterium]
MNQNRPGQQPIRLGVGGGGHLTGEAAQDTRTTMVKLLNYLGPYRPTLILVALLVLIVTAANLLGPILVGRAIDKYVIPRDLPGLFRLSLMMLGVYVVAGAASILQGMLMVNVAQGLVADIRSELFAHLQHLSMAFFDRRPVGDLMSRVSNDTDTINTTLSNGLIEFTTNILTLGGIMVAMFFLNWQLAIGTLILLPIMLWITGEVTRRSRILFRNVQRNLGTLNAEMEENIAGLRAIQAFAREEETLAEFRQINAANRDAGIKADVIIAALGPMFTTMSTITIAATVLLGGWLALRGVVEVGVIATFVIYIMNFFRPMRAIAMLYNQLQSSLAGAERIFAVLAEKPSVQDKPDAQPLPSIQGDVRFDHVDFAYTAGKLVLIDVNMQAQPGQTVALVGPTGAGKTTIINLLSRFYDVTGGAIYVDGHDIRTVQQASLRQQLGIVLQDTFLFSATVMDNLRYGRLGATDEEVIAAAQLANADRFIRLLPQGYQTKVSERGHNFSQGQRQLLAIARAILADPRILILDEATSSVDTRTEMQIQEALLNLLKGRTAVVIAHRLSTILNADQVLVINDHRIIERGTHAELIAQQGFYYNLYMSQYKRVQMVMAASD